MRGGHVPALRFDPSSSPAEGGLGLPNKIRGLAELVEELRQKILAMPIDLHTEVE
ncbi:hypothetical protein THTE_0377 [Thermogutta terrifontis]|uniref:Uncharacterized protein n=2 Tax=Thermogutta terrifontis TaxID=1331910 RepID=A0A286RAJ4_9BACT|nr:hypothetical protein THTE_0377 [Thermogutta terrifontis]